MEKKTVIVGASPFSSMMRAYMEHAGRDVVAYAVESHFRQQDTFDNRPLIDFEALPRLFPATQYCILNTIGYVKMNGCRKRLFLQCKEWGYTLVSYIHPSAMIASPIGDGCIILENCIVGMRNVIGDGCLMYGGVNISHDCLVGDFSYWGPGAISCGNVVIGSRCFIGAGAILRNRIQIAESCLIGAGVFMNHSIEEPNLCYRAPHPVLHPQKADNLL